MNEVSIVNRTSVAVTQERLDVWKKLYCAEASDAETQVFLRTCKETGLSPEKRQIYLVPRFSQGRKMFAPQTSIDGFRAIAERSSVYGGQTPTQWCGLDGKWVDVWLVSAPPAAARVGVIRKDWSAPLYAVARWDAYKQEGKNGLTEIWRKMPDVMLAKCAEALALRKAFPNEMHGLYTEDEMGQAQAIQVESTPIKIEDAKLVKFEKERHWEWAKEKLKLNGKEAYLDLLEQQLEDKFLDRDSLDNTMQMLRKCLSDAINSHITRVEVMEG